MTSPQLAEQAVQLTLLAPCRHAGLAAGQVAKQFGLTPAAAEALLAGSGGVIASQMGLAAARALVPFMAVLGVQLGITSLQPGGEPESFDLSLRLAAPELAGETIGVLGRFGLGQGLTCADFTGASGLVLGALTHGKAQTLTAALRRVAGVQAVPSDRTSALYDLFAPEAGLGVEGNALRHHLRILGCQAQGPANALATGLDRRTLNHVLARFPRLGLLPVNQAFQRYHLVLTGHGRLSPQEVQDFLATRGAKPGLVRALGPGAGRVVQIETGLSRSAARQFMADYATIGLPARADLMRV